MALSKKENAKKSREYYKKNTKYREEKKEDRLAYAKSHKKEEAKQSKKYYWAEPEYRQKKRKYARDYKKAHKNN